MKNTSSSSSKEVLTPEEIEKLLSACGGGALGARNRAIIMMLWKAGLRRAELCDLVPADLNWRENKVRVRNGKGGVDDFSILPNSVKPYLESWMLHREKLGLGNKDPLFCATSKNTGAALFPTYIWNRLQALAKKANLTKRVHPHMFRRSCATQLLNRGYSLTEVQSQLRHRSTSSTHHYLVIAQKEELAAKMADTW